MHLSPSCLALLASVTAALGAVVQSPTQLNTLNYDYVIVGGGTAGLVLAKRLSDLSNVQVLVLEAGGSTADIASIEVPFLAPTLANSAYDWNYTTTNQLGFNNRSISYSRGFGLGGSSAINYMVYNRGSRDDWDSLAAYTGDDGWSWNNMTRFFALNERWLLPSSGRNTTGEYRPSNHSTTGLLDVSLPSYNWPTDALLVETTKQLQTQFPFQLDHNGGDTIGIGWLQASIGNGTRSTSSTAYLSPVNGRPNLHVLLNAHVTQIIQTGQLYEKPVFGSVAFNVSGKSYTATARKEIILSAGSLNTPQLLLLSGLGPKEELSALGIKTIVDLPSVGKNVSDHALVYNVYSTAPYNSFANHSNLTAELPHWQATRQGPLADTNSNLVGWLRVPDNDPIFDKYHDPSTGPTSAHFELLFGNGYSDPTSPPPPADAGSFMTVATIVISPTSRGSVTLASVDPFAMPVINPNFLQTELDLYIMAHAVKAVKQLFTAPAWSNFILGPYGDLAYTNTTTALDTFIRNHSATVFHACGSAGMSPSGASYGVVNPDLRVKGTVGLRVVDSSALPRVPSGHPQGAVYFLAERAAALILKDQ